MVMVVDARECPLLAYFLSCDFITQAAIPFDPHQLYLVMAFTYQLSICLLAVSAVGAVLDGTKFPRPPLTRLKARHFSGRVELPTGLISELMTKEEKAVQNGLVRSKRDDGDNCGFDKSDELEISPVS